MNILITSSRAPVALELIRTFGRAGHNVYATDTMRWTVGSHSCYLAQHIVTPPPRYDSAGFAAALLQIIARAQIDWLIPTSEEVFFVARHYQALAAHTRVFTEPLAVLDLLHHKHHFQLRCAALGILTPRTVLACDTAELRAALPCFPAYLLKPAYSRFATQIITNCGPRAGQIALERCRPTPAQPWLIQQYIAGESICSYSTLHSGHVTAHCAYITPRKVNHGSGVQFESIDGAATLAIVQRLGAALGYTGQLSLDFIRGEDGLYLLECNPRATSGVHLLDPQALIGGLTDPNQPTWVGPAGRCGQLTLALLASGPAQLRDLARVRDVIFDRADPLPALIQLRAALTFAAISRRKRIGLVAAMTDDIEWNGELKIENHGEPRAEEPRTVYLRLATDKRQMNPQIYDRRSIEQVPWPATPDGAYARSLLGPLIRHGPQRLIDNVDAEVRVLVAGDLVLPLVLGNPAASVKNSYVCSPTTHYIDYAKREVEIELHDQPFARALIPPMLDLLRPLLLWSKFEQVVFVNNWLLSTNLYPLMPQELMQALRDLLVRSFPQHAIIFRSVNDQLNADLMDHLQALDFRKVFSRQVYILDPHDTSYQQKKSYQKDRSLARRSAYAWANADEIKPEDIARIKALYDDLYLKKYSFHNPQFNRHFFAEALRERWLTFLVLKQQGRIDGVLGFVERNGVMTTPLIGYDRSVDPAAGLYRLISLELVEQAAARGLILHQSSGAAAFKRHRGSTASMEYNLIYDRHLAPRYRLPWQLLEALSRAVIMPVMRRYGL